MIDVTSNDNVTNSLLSLHIIIRNYLVYFTFLVLIYYEQYFFGIVYLLGYELSKIIKSHVKNLIKEERPYNEKFTFTNNMKYGMPSGHTLYSFYSSTFVWLVIDNVYIHVLYSLLCAYTFLLSFLTLAHTIKQLLVGAIIGVSISSAILSLTYKIKHHFDTYIF
jgi:hypothetical protein